MSRIENKKIEVAQTCESLSLTGQTLCQEILIIHEMVDELLVARKKKGEYMVSDVFYDKGLALSKLDKYEKAISCFNKALKIDPKHVDALTSKGVIYGKLGKYEKAILWFDKALKIDPKYVDPLIDKGLALFKLERYGEAMECFDKVLKIDPTNEVALKINEVLLETLTRNY